MDSPDMSKFTSRFLFKGRLIFDSAHRIGAERSLAVDAPDTPILRTANGFPFIPGSSIKGAWRSYTEAVLRTLQDQQGHFEFASDPLLQDKSPDAGLTHKKAERIKQQYEKERKSQEELDAALRHQSTWTERLFGNGVLASKILIKDAVIDESAWLRSEIRDGVGIDRDSGRAGDRLKYQFEVVPVGAVFPFEVVVENASPAELGLVVLGLKAFVRGDILLGGAKSRGLGWCHLEVDDWSQCRYMTADTLLDYLLGEDQDVGQVSQDTINEWVVALREVIAQRAVEGVSNA
jgi:CRISPR-associated RAMP protein (TIGR02581 family)